MGLVFNMGIVLFHRALCLEGLQQFYICAGEYLFVCACAYVREDRIESVAMHFYMSSHWFLHMKHHGSEDLNTRSSAILLRFKSTVAINAL